MSKLSKNAFAIMAMCEKTKEPFGITIDPREGCYAFAWAFKIKKDQAKREGYDKTHVHGAEFQRLSALWSQEFLHLQPMWKGGLLSWSGSSNMP